MHIYLLSKSVGCYKMKKLLPKRFHNVDLKSDNERMINVGGIVVWKHRMTNHGGHCKKYKTIDKTFFT